MIPAIDYFLPRGKKDEIYLYSSKEHPKISKIVAKYEKYSPLKLAKFEYLSITRGKMHHIRLKSGVFFRS